MYILEKRNRLRQLRTNLRKIASVVLMDTSKDYLDLQRDQLLHGLNSDGDHIGVYASTDYAAMKERMNPLAGGYVDLKLHGDFQDELTLRVMGEKKFIVYSQDAKNAELIRRYGAGIFLLSPEFLQRYRRETFMPELNKSAKDFIDGRY